MILTVCGRCADFSKAKEESRPSFRSFWKDVLGTYDPVSYVFDLNHTIRQIPCADVVKRGLEELSLKYGCDIRDDNNHPRVQWLLAEERKEISSVVGYKGKLPLADDLQQLPVF
jgi:hypothetical protein